MELRPARIVSLVVGCLLVIPAFGLLFGGGALGLGYAFGRDDSGYFDVTLRRLDTETVAITADDVTFAAEPGSPDWILDALDVDVRITATNASGADVFVGIGSQADVDTYLAGVAHDEVADIRAGSQPIYRRRAGTNDVAAPVEEDFWVATATGPGTQELLWDSASGTWSAVIMNADASPRVLADVNVGAKAGFVLPLALIMLGVGAFLTAAAVILIVVGATGKRDDQHVSEAVGTVPEPPPPTVAAAPVHQHQSVALTGVLDPELSRWQWLVKWFLAIPHFIVLAFLWLAFTVLTLVAAVAIVFTGRYPRSIFDFNAGVLRWTWRVSYYATTGGIGTDRYPPFSLHPERGDLATLDIVYPEHLSRGLVFVKWLLAIPHLIIVALLAGASMGWAFGGDRVNVGFAGGLLGLLVLAAGIMLLFAGRYPTGLFGLIVGFNRWIYRVIAYVALMTDEYPPFRLDQGGSEPSAPDRPDPLPPPTPAISTGQPTIADREEVLR